MRVFSVYLSFCHATRGVLISRVRIVSATFENETHTMADGFERDHRHEQLSRRVKRINRWREITDRKHARLRFFLSPSNKTNRIPGVNRCLHAYAATRARCRINKIFIFSPCWILVDTCSREWNTFYFCHVALFESQRIKPLSNYINYLFEYSTYMYVVILFLPSVLHPRSAGSIAWGLNSWPKSSFEYPLVFSQHLCNSIYS